LHLLCESADYYCGYEIGLVKAFLEIYYVDLETVYFLAIVDQYQEPSASKHCLDPKLVKRCLDRNSGEK
jgi:hypothetical protein